MSPRRGFMFLVLQLQRCRAHGAGYAIAQTLIRPAATFSHPMGEGIFFGNVYPRLKPRAIFSPPLHGLFEICVNRRNLRI